LSGGNAGTYVGGTAGSRVSAVFGGFSAANEQEQIYTGSIVYLDSPATTSATTYTLGMKSNNAGGSIYAQAAFLGGTGSFGSITAWEISE
jgi:hypothetical protein